MTDLELLRLLTKLEFSKEVENYDSKFECLKNALILINSHYISQTHRPN